MGLKSGLLSAALLLASVGAAASLELQSADIAPGATIAAKHVYKGFGCAGGNISPALSWSGAPEGTKSFALLMHDPDAPTGGAGFWHWIVYDIPATATGLPAGDSGKGLPVGAKQLTTDFGKAGYGGPCPPEGAAPHHYNLTLYALKIAKLPVTQHTPASLAGFMINSNAIATATLTGLYGR